MGIPIVATDSSLHSPNLPAIKAVQGECETV